MITATKTLSASRTKAETLQYISESVLGVQILPLFYFDQKTWNKNSDQVLADFYTHSWANAPLVVRSSCQGEDSIDQSFAGAFISFLDVKTKQELVNAINRVFESYQTFPHENNQVLIQPFLQNVKISGVLFSKDPKTHQNYYVINYDDQSKKTDTVTSGSTNCLKTYVHHKSNTTYPNSFIEKLILASQKLEVFFQNEALDIEFAIDQSNQLYIFQVRPLVLDQKNAPSKIEDLTPTLTRISKHIEALSLPHPYLYGSRSLFGNMTDWNPAEIIGAKPRPLSLSLYRELVTDHTWAYQRNNYGYLNLRSFPLLIDFEGIPYIDIRVSFNSFIPKSLPNDLANKLVEYYLDRLQANPHLHDKVEFDIVFAGYHFALKDKLRHLSKSGFSAEEIETLFDSLNHLTQNIATSDTALWKKDLEKIETLKKRQEDVYHHEAMSPLSKMYWLIEDCKRYGVLPFAGLARAGFIGVEILKSLHYKELLTNEQYDSFFKSLKTVSSQIQEDFTKLHQNEFMNLYGHLRPGTYDILLPSYSQAPDLYFQWDSKRFDEKITKHYFEMNLEQLRVIQNALDQDGWSIDVLTFFEFVKSVIEGREYAKFIFTKSIHYFFDLFANWAIELGFSKEDCSYIDLKDVLALYSRSDDITLSLKNSLRRGKEKYELMQSINLPSIILSSKDPFGFHHLDSCPNYITRKIVTAETVPYENIQDKDLAGKIVIIPQADPGFDWLFIKNIGGLVTQYGGVNSHMAIRANELGIPAIIGCGPKIYDSLQKAKLLKIDCAGQKYHILKT